MDKSTNYLVFSDFLENGYQLENHRKNLGRPSRYSRGQRNLILG